MRVPGSLASDVRSLDALKAGAARDPSGAVRQAASQFEALFMQMVMKSMRDAVPRSGMLEGAGSDVYRSMLDTQFAQALSGRPGGLSELIARQLMRNMRSEHDASDAPGAAPATPKVSVQGLERALQGQAAAAAAAAAEARERAVPVSRGPQGMPVLGAPSLGERAAPAAAAPPPAQPGARPRGAPAAFVDRMWAAASSAERATGVPAGFIVGQAALESGWGRHEIRHADGRSAHNLFGIKAGPGWRGPVAESVTTEYVDGRPVRSVERFRAYASYEESFADWARLMAANPRYAGVLRTEGKVEDFAQALQRAGYATDPAYASKLTRTITQALSLRRVTT